MRECYLLPLCVIIAFSPHRLFAQRVPTTTLKGTVLDDSTRKPVPATNVFIAGSTLGASSDSDGRFEIQRVPLGYQVLVASHVAYFSHRADVRLTDSAGSNFLIILRPQTIQMPLFDVEGKKPSEWHKQLERFKKEFFGSTDAGLQCKLINPEILDFKSDHGSGEFSATAREPLLFVNDFSGYRVRCILMLFTVHGESFRFVGDLSYEPLLTNDETRRQTWNENREKAYRGSKRHFLYSLVRKMTRQEGFTVRDLGTELSPSALQRPMGNEVDPDTLLTFGDWPFEKKLSFFPNVLQITYSDRTSWHYSLIELSAPTSAVYLNGQNPLGIVTRGYWAQQRAGELLPFNFKQDRQ